MNQRKSILRTAIMAILLTSSLVLAAQVTITPCSSTFTGSDMTINSRHPHDAFFTGGSAVIHVSSVDPEGGPCAFGPLAPDISLGAGISVSRGIALDRHANLFVAAGNGAATTILKIARPYDGAPTIFFKGATDLRGLAIRGSILYAADLGSGKVLRFNLNRGAGSVSTFATIPGAFGVFAAGRDDLFVTSNAGAGGTDDIKHVTRDGVTTIATGLGFPEGIYGDEENLYIASDALVFTVPRKGGTPILYAGSPILFSHSIFVFDDGGYVSDSSGPAGHVFKFRLIDDDDHDGNRGHDRDRDRGRDRD